MTEQQELILDHLVAAHEIGEHWRPGPLQLACDALIEGGFTRDTDMCQVLGFPRLFCDAVAGASEYLDNIEHRRTLAIALFSEVPPRTEVPQMSPQESLEMAVWCAKFAYQHSSKPHRLCDDASVVLEQAVTDESGPSAYDIAKLDRRFDQIFPQLLRHESRRGESMLLSVFFFALHAARLAALGDTSEYHVGCACRDAGRYMAFCLGVDGAVEFCLELGKVMKWD